MRDGGSRKEDVQVSRLPSLPPPQQVANLAGPPDPTRTRQSTPPRRPRPQAPGAHGSYFDPIRTVRRRRPLPRRRERTWRPFFVFIRARNPCLFSRLRFRGLYVGFMDRSALAGFEVRVRRAPHARACPPAISFLVYPIFATTVNPARKGAKRLRRSLAARPVQGTAGPRAAGRDCAKAPPAPLPHALAGASAAAPAGWRGRRRGAHAGARASAGRARIFGFSSPLTFPHPRPTFAPLRQPSNRPVVMVPHMHRAARTSWS